MARKNDLVTFTPPKETPEQRRVRRLTEATARSLVLDPESVINDSFPPSPMKSHRGDPLPHNGRGPVSTAPPVHRASTRVLGGAYPFLAATGAMSVGGVVGRDMYSRQPFPLDLWEWYSQSIIRSLAMVVFGTLGTGKSLFLKVLADRLMALGRKVCVPADPKGEWTVVADAVHGSTIRVGPGLNACINFLDPGPARPDMSTDAFREHVRQNQLALMKAAVSILRGNTLLAEEEHTALDVALASVARSADAPVISLLLERLVDPDPADRAVVDPDDGKRLAHTLRRLVAGDLRGMFDGHSTVAFDIDAPIVTVDTSALKRSAPEAKALMTLATSNWSKQAISVPGRGKRALIHEEAAIALLSEVAAGIGLGERTTQQKLGRDDGVANIYAFHKMGDLHMLGDKDSATYSQAIGLIQDTDVRAVFGQKSDAIPALADTLGLNETQRTTIQQLEIGQALFLVGERRKCVVEITPTEAEFAMFETDDAAGARS